MKNLNKLLFVANLLLISSTINAQYLVTATQIASLSASSVEAYLISWGWDTSPMTLNGVISYKITYNTTDVFGNPTVASGALYVPQLCDTMPWVSNQHGTEFEKLTVPSNNYYRADGLFFAGNGYITTLPDYLGMGVNLGIHPYVHWESEATASIDLIRAAREYLSDTFQILDNNQLFLTGYSQGGHSTMAIHKYITVNGLQSEFNVVASAPMSGPYPMYSVAIPDIFDEDSTYYWLEFIPYLFASYQLVYGNLYANYNEYYDPPYDTQIPLYLNGSYTNWQWSTFLPYNYYEFMQDSVIYNIKNNPNHPVNIALRDNDLHNWIPQEPVRMLYCGMDSMVFPQNSTMARDTMNALGAPDVQAIEIDANGDHYTCFMPAMTYALEWFDSLKVECGMITSIPSIKKQPEISLYPNPVKDLATFSSSEITSLEIYDLMGAIIERRNGNKVNMSNLPSGIYFVIGFDKNSAALYLGKVVKK